MTKERLEAFSDGEIAIAIMITILLSGFQPVIVLISVNQAYARRA